MSAPGCMARKADAKKSGWRSRDRSLVCPSSQQVKISFDFFDEWRFLLPVLLYCSPQVLRFWKHLTEMGQTASSPATGATMPTHPKMAQEHPTGSTAKPPPECPMHASNASASPYAPAPPALQPQPSSPDSKPAQCPVQHGQSPLSGLGGGSSITKSSTTVGDGELNPLNQMPTLSHQRAPGQEMELPTERTTSTIPRPHAEEKVWEYPSPQQFYNALVRKGWETPEEHVETMVDIHNFLNEEAWQEVLKWESNQRGYVLSVRLLSPARVLTIFVIILNSGRDVQLARFQGRPGALSPKATLHLLAGKVFPSKFK